jgi:hypothetical protein
MTRTLAYRHFQQAVVHSIAIARRGSLSASPGVRLSMMKLR